MSKIKQVMRMRCSSATVAAIRQIGRSGMYKGTVNDYVRRIEAYPLPVKEHLEILYMNGDVTDGTSRETAPTSEAALSASAAKHLRSQRVRTHPKLINIISAAKHLPVHSGRLSKSSAPNPPPFYCLPQTNDKPKPIARKRTFT